MSAYPPHNGGGGGYPPQYGSNVSYPPTNSHQVHPSAHDGYGKNGPHYGNSYQQQGGSQYDKYGGGGGGGGGGSSGNAGGHYGNAPAPVNASSRFEPPAERPDFWAAILFYIMSFVFFAILVFCLIRGTRKVADSQGRNVSSYESVDFKGAHALSLSLGVATAFIYSAFLIWILRSHPRFFIKFLMGMTLLSVLAVSIISPIVNRNATSCIFGVVFLIIMIIFYFIIRKRIPFAAALLEITANTTQKYPGLIGSAVVTALVRILVLAAWVGIAILSSTALLPSNYQPSGDSKSDSVIAGSRSKGAAIAFGALFPLYWILQVVHWTQHVIVCGVFATFFFLPSDAVPSNPTLKSVKRALGYSFGPICFGSIILSFVEFLKSLAENGSRNHGDGFSWGSFICCICACFLSCIISMFEFISSYAFVQVAIYGKGFCVAARDTFALMRDRGVEMFINNSITSMVVNASSSIAFILCAGLSALCLFFQSELKKDATTAQNITAAIVCAISGLIGFMVTSLIGGIITSGVASLFVCLAEDPSALYRNHPRLWQMIRETNPDAAFFGMHNT